MVFVFKGYDENGVPIYVDVPYGDQDIDKPQEAAVTPKEDAIPPSNPASDFCTVRGGTVDGENCILSDGTVCTLQDFYQGNCNAQGIFVPRGVVLGAALVIAFFAFAVITNY